MKTAGGIHRLKRILLGSGPCLDSVALLRLYLAALKKPVLRQLAIASRLKFSAAILDKIRNCGLGPEEKGRLFSGAMTLFRSGPTYKTTDVRRSPLTDGAIRSKLAPGILVLEVGVSDGASALPLLENPAGAEIMLSDRQSRFRCRAFGPCRIFYDQDDEFLCLRIPLFFICAGLTAGAVPAGTGEIPLTNPLVREKFNAEVFAFDVFTGTLPRKADVIKCANLLNAVYFRPQEIKRAVANLSRNLNENGRLFISHNNPRYESGEAFFCLQKRGNALVLEEEAGGHELLPLIKSWGGVV